MTLKEKFENILHNWIEKDYNRQNVANELQINADDFAIGFLNWGTTYKANDKNNWQLTSQQLLEMYKKKQNL
jgi:hypothetical protein